MPPCWDFKRHGHCSRGESCYYRHVEGQIIPPVADRGEKVWDFSIDSLSPTKDEVSITQYRELASYNWTTSLKSQILVPGLCSHTLRPVVDFERICPYAEHTR